ncbi:MAG: metalloregulator ArsR/SmtB family transcription factor [Cyanobacteria bacterium P01_D01_bin.115]
MTLPFDQAATPIADEPPFERWADRFRLLSDPSRLRILAAICQSERNVTEICALTGLNQANVSKHLQLLKAAGAVACRRVGICRYYRIIDADLLALCPSSFADIQH